MTPESKHLVQETWERVLPDGGRFADTFMDRLLALDPPLRSLLAEPDRSEAGRRLVRTLTATVRGLGEEWAPADGSSPAHLAEEARQARVDQALLWTLEQMLGEGLPPEGRAAWTDFLAAHGAAIRLAVLGETAPPRGLMSARHRFMQAGS
ncbi:MAG TPA: hypothetical protein VF746_31335 [Longimicrobium sp.]|jgi:hypothetical protein